MADPVKKNDLYNNIYMATMRSNVRKADSVMWAALFDALPTESHKIGIILDKADSYMYRNKRICKDTFRAGQMAAE